MLPSLKRVLDRGTRATELHECRRCGTAVEHPTGGCPACGSNEIASYRI